MLNKNNHNGGVIPGQHAASLYGLPQKEALQLYYQQQRAQQQQQQAHFQVQQAQQQVQQTISGSMTYAQQQAHFQVQQAQAHPGGSQGQQQCAQQQQQHQQSGTGSGYSEADWKQWLGI